jgi:hypothetical protein
MKARGAARPSVPRSPEERVMETIRAGYHGRDAALVASVYAEDVECTVVNRNHPPSNPLVLRGREALQAMLGELCEREMSHEIITTVAGEGSLAYRVHCRYPDGCQVFGVYLATVRDGRVVREFSVDCWDE